jgi:hypothetical protein
MARLLRNLLVQLLLAAASVRSEEEITTGSSRIVGGSAAIPGRYQYFVDLLVSPAVSGPSFICGGALIHSDIVLTAAQCYREGGTISVRVNAYTRTDGIARTAEKIVPHPDYTNSFDNDIMVLKLNQKVSTQPVAYNTGSNIPVENQVLSIFGFGASSELDSTPSTQLMEVDVFTGDFNECNLQYAFMLDPFLHACTIGPPEGGKDACDGDGGAPLIVKGRQAATDVIVGIVSFGFGCGRPDSYSGNTNVAGYAEWIKNQICDLSSERPSDCPISSFACFSGSSIVNVLGRGPTQLREVRLRDKVMVRPNRYEPLYSFGHYSPDSRANFLEISTEKSTMQISRDHMVFVDNHRAIPASMIQVGGQLVDESGSTVSVMSIKSIVAQGLFAPFTPSGTIVVDNLLASSYVSLEDSTYLKVGGIGVSYHWAAHAFQFPHRVWCHYLKACPGEAYAANGISFWVETPRDLADRLLGQRPLLRNCLLVWCVLVLGGFYILEHWWRVIVCCGLFVIVTRRQNLITRVKAH